MRYKQMDRDARRKYLTFMVVFFLFFIASLGVTIVRWYNKNVFSKQGIIRTGSILKKKLIDTRSYEYLISYTAKNNESEHVVMMSDYDFGVKGDSVGICYLEGDEQNPMFVRDLSWNSFLIGPIVATAICGVIVFFGLVCPDRIGNLKGDLSH